MLDDFFTRALLAGLGLAALAGPFGCFIVWRRMSYFGDTMAHSALLGIVLAFLLDIWLMAGVFAVAVFISLALLFLQNRNALPTDALLGILSHSALAAGLVLLAMMSWIRVDLMGFLFGDILAVTRTDLFVIYAGGLVIAGLIVVIWRPLLAATVNSDLARAEGQNPERAELIFMLLMAGIIAMAMKIVGILLITALLIIPAAAARRFSTSPEMMAFIASLLGVCAVTGGLAGSLQFDTPSGPSIVVAALALFILSLIPWPFRKIRTENTGANR